MNAEDVHGAIASGDMHKLREACDWASKWHYSERNPSRTAIIGALLDALHTAQRTTFYVAKRQMTMSDVDVITTITPYNQRLQHAAQPAWRYNANTVIEVILYGIETECDGAPLTAMTKWCWCHENDLVHRRSDESLLYVLHNPLDFCCWEPRRDRVRQENGSVVERRDRYFEGSVLLAWKLHLRRLAFFLEVVQGCVPDDVCIVLFERFVDLREELAMCPSVVSPIALADFSEVLDYALAAVAASCRWNELRRAWVGAVVRSTVCLKVFPSLFSVTHNN